MYRNALSPSKLFALILLVFAAAGMVLWLGCFVDTAMPAFDATGVMLLGLTLMLLILSILLLRRVRWVRVATSILLHILGAALLASLLYTLPMAEDMTEGAIIISFTGLLAGLLFVAILGLHSDAMKRDMAAGSSRNALKPSRKRKYIAAAVGCMLLIAALAACQVVPLLLAEPTITVDYLAQANQENKPADYDPNRNAAPHYERLFSQFTPLPEVLSSVWKSWPGDLEPSQYRALEEWAPVNASALQVLSQAAQCSYWWFEMKSDTGALSGIQVPYQDQTRNCAWGGILLAKFKAHQGDIGGAMQLLTDVHMMGIHRAEGGTLLEQLTGVAICGLVYSAVYAILDHCEADKDLLRRTLDTLSPRMPLITVPRFSEVERLYGLDSIQRLFTDNGDGDGRLIPERLYLTKMNRRSLYTLPISYLDAFRICVTHPGRVETTCLSEAYFAFVKDLAGQTPWEVYRQESSYEEQLKGLLDGNYYLQDGLAAMGEVIRVGWRSRVSGEAMMTVLAIFLYKGEKGRLPESLRQVVDAGLLRSIPMDPYSGGPLVYRVTEDDFMLYSVGEDFVDDEGWACEWEDGFGDRVFWPIAEPEDCEDEE